MALLAPGNCCRLELLQAGLQTEQVSAGAICFPFLRGVNFVHMHASPACSAASFIRNVPTHPNCSLMCKREPEEVQVHHACCLAPHTMSLVRLPCRLLHCLRLVLRCSVHAPVEHLPHSL